jgi:hypothetical protein
MVYVEGTPDVRTYTTADGRNGLVENLQKGVLVRQMVVHLTISLHKQLLILMMQHRH